MFREDAVDKKGTSNSEADQPNTGAAAANKPVFTATPAKAAGMNPPLKRALLTAPTMAPANAMPKAMGRCKSPKGNPFMIEVMKCPNPVTTAPSMTPKYRAAKKPGAESKAIV